MCICIQIKKIYIIFIYFTWCNYIKRTGLTIEYTCTLSSEGYAYRCSVSPKIKKKIC